MSLWTMIFLIVIVGIAYSVWQKKHDSSQGIVRDRRGDPLPPPEPGSEREEELQSEVEQLRERIAVLERIATDPARRTADEIEKLRDD